MQVEPLESSLWDEPFLDVTYESLGINVDAFYAGKFGYRNKLTALAGRLNRLKSGRSQFDIETTRLRFLTENLSGGRVLDIGCGSGLFGATLKQACGVQELIGVDFDPTCVRQASKTYDRAEVVDLNRSLPFPNSHFDAVVSLDLFGHIEFRHKDALIREVSRVTKPGGRSLHAIESGELDYHRIDKGDPDDPLLKYVKMEGHVGIESASRIDERWRQSFAEVTVENAFVFPLLPLAALTAEGSGVSEDFASVVARLSPSAQRGARIVLGFVSDYFKSIAREVDPKLLMPGAVPASESPSDRLAARIYQPNCGLVLVRAEGRRHCGEPC